MAERRRLSRRDFSYYMRVMNDATGELVGHLTDISTAGFKLDCVKSIQPNTDLLLRIDLTPEIAPKEFLVFAARCRWCRPDRFDPTAFNVGFQITDISTDDMEIFTRMYERYGTQPAQNKSSNDYLWR
ncbi:MAG: PilZ domain-containing protein [Bacteroidota bacterium]